MKLSFMTFACPTWSAREVVNAAIQHGYHGIEFRCDADHDHGVEINTSKSVRKSIVKTMHDNGIAACCLATSLQCINEKSVEEARARIDLAFDMHAPALRVFCGALPDGVHRADAVHRVANHLREIAHLAAPARVELWLETHDTFCKGVDAAAAVREANHPGIGVNYDNMHPFRKGETVEETFAVLNGLIRHTHFHDAMNSAEQVLIKPLGQGELPMDEMFEQLTKSGYTGYLSGEWFNDMYGADPNEALAQYYQDMTSLAERHGVHIG